jgi:hypothetical protein
MMTAAPGGIAMRLATAFAILLLLAVKAYAQELPAPVAQWYGALRKGDAAAFEGLMTAGAAVEIRQSGITQSRAEFIESLPAWAQIVKEGEMLLRLVSSEQDTVVVDVCYRFPGAARLNRESFTLEAGRIARLVQEEARTDCPGF